MTNPHVTVPLAEVRVGDTVRSPSFGDGKARIVTWISYQADMWAMTGLDGKPGWNVRHVQPQLQYHDKFSQGNITYCSADAVAEIIHREEG